MQPPLQPPLQPLGDTESNAELDAATTLPRNLSVPANAGRTLGPDAQAPRGDRPRLGPYELVRTLGVGGMGEVHEAIDTRSGQHVALKMIFEVDAAGVYRLKREFRRMADISHENLVTLHELGHDRERWYFTMELLHGGDLGAALRAARLADPAGEALRGLLRQFVHGVHALHTAGKIHRDLKPSNVLVTDAGRVVILDFGLVNEIDHRTLFASSRGLIRGTPAYMSPEQAAGQLATPASDWYAVGAILFEVMTGRFPFVGGAMQIILDKQYEDPPRASHFNPRVPPELDDLIAALLRRVPGERPGVTELLAWCARGRSPVTTPVPRIAATGDLIEREPQLEQLHAGFRQVLAGRPTCVDLVGPAGCGKTALLRHFVAQLDEPDLVVLESSCSAREALPFRAFDGLVDALAGHLLRISEAERDALIAPLGESLYALAQIFPVLARVPWIANQTPISVPEPQEMRRRAFHGLKSLLFRVAEQRPLIVFLDSLQWGDGDSARLLDDLLAPPGVPPLLLVSAYRREATPMLRDIALLRAMVTPAYALRMIEIPPLSLAAATRLALRLQGGEATPRRTRSAEHIARESAGNPALLRALALELAQTTTSPAGELTLPGGEGDLLRPLVRARLDRVVAEAREALARVIAAGALPLSRLQRAGPWQGDLRALITQLQGQNLVQVEGQPPVVSPFDESIQLAALKVLGPELLRHSHVVLAEALLAEHSDDSDRIARHRHAGGRVDAAVEHASAAAYAASQALAFDHAAELYRFAIACKPPLWNLSKNCAEALVQAGRGAEAAPLFLSAADAAPPNIAVRLRREAAEQYLNHGYLDRGLEILQPLLREAGITVPERPRELNAQLVAHTDVVVRRGLKFAEHSEFEIARRELHRIDLCWVAGKGLLLNDPIRSGVFLAQCTYLALEAGEPRRVARSLALFGMAHASRSHEGGLAMLAAAEQLGQRIHDPYSVGLATLCKGIQTRTDGHWLAALADLDFGVQYLREHCPGSAWECSLGQGSTMAALEALGELRTISERSEQMLRRAQDSGDMHTSLIAAMYSALTLLASGEPNAARSRVRGALAHWPRQGFHVQHLHALKIEVSCDLYERRPADAWQRIVTAWSQLEDSSFLRLAARRAEALILRARASIATLRAAPDEHEHLASVAAGDIAQLEREGHAHLRAEAALLRAGLARCTGDEDGLARHLDAAIGGFEAAGMQLSALAARRLRARTPDAQQRAEALMRMQNITDPAAWSRVVAPGLAT